GLLVLQAGVVAAPRALPSLPLLRRVRGPAWALVPIGSIVVVVFAIRFLSDTATGLTYLAVVAVPPLAAVALAWAARPATPVSRSRMLLAVAVTAGLFALAWAGRRSLAGDAAAALLSALSCVTLGALLGAVAPGGWLKLGIIAMAVADTWLVVADLLQSPNAALIAAHPGGGLPRLQTEIFGSVTMGYGDLFAAALLGAVLAALFDLLFLAVNELPATVPVALALIVIEAWDRLRRPRPGPSAARLRSPPAAGTPQRAR